MAANTRISYSVGLNVDTKQAKQDMNELLKTVTDISKQAVVSYDTRAVKEGIAAAKELEKHLTKAFNVQTGNLDLSKFNASLRQSGSSLESLSNKLMSFGPSGQAAFNQLANSISSAQLPLRQTNQMVDNLLINLKKTAQWQISSSIIHGVVGQINSAIGYVRNLNKSLTDIAIVSDLSSAQLSKFAVEAHKLGKSLSTSTLDVTNAALIYFQQGDNVLRSMEKAAITIKAANASANSSAAEMSEYLTAIWNSYKVGSSDLEQYVDMMAALGAKTATSMEEIATAMQKVAATANTVGVQFDQMSSIISTVSSVTRESAESIGTSYKTILARIGDLKLGNLVEDGATVTLGQVSSQLKAIGINVLNAKGDMRDMGTVIEEIGFKWQGMNDAQKAAVAQAIAGKRQYTQLMALFENWDMYQENMSIAGDSEGALDEMQNKWAEGWEAASNRVRNSMEGIYSSLINDKFVTGTLNVFAEMISGIDSVIDSMGGLGSVIALVGGIFTTKLGGRTTEVIDSLRTNLGLMTGQARKDMVALNQDLSIIATKQALSPDATQAQKTHWDSMSKATKARSSMLRNQNELSLEQREAFDRESQKFDEAAARKEQAEAESASLQRSIANKSNTRKNTFMDSSLIDAGEVSEESVAIREAASAAQAAADEAQNKMIQAQNAVDSARADRDSLQAELDALTAEADKHYDKEQQYRDAARLKNDGSSQQGKLEYKAEEEAKKAEALQEQIDAKTAELQKLEQRVQEAENHEKNAAKEAVRKSEAAKSAKKKAKDVAGGENTKILKEAKKEMEKNLKDVENIPPVKLELDKLIQLQESGASTEALSEQGEKLYEALESGLLESVQTSMLADKFNQSIAAELTNIDVDLKAIDTNVEGIDPTAMLAQQKQAVADLMADMAGAGVQIPVTIDLDSITSLEQLKAKMTEVQTAVEQMGTGAAASADAIEDLMGAFGAGDEAAAIRADADALARLRQEAGEAEEDMHYAGEAMEGLAIPTTTSLDAITSLVGGLSTLVGMGATIKGVFDTFQDADATPIEKITAALTLAGTALATYNALQSMGTTLKNAYITAQAKSIMLDQKTTIEKAKTIAVEKLQQATEAKSVIGKWLYVAAQSALNVVTIIYKALTNPIGLAIALVAAAAGIAAIAIMSQAKAQEKLNEQTAAVTSGMEEQANAANKLKGDLQSLASILHNTGLSYEEQLSKINEVTAAYGVQATMLDVLSGNYERLESKMRSAALGEAILTAEDATDTRELAEQTAQTRVNNRTVTTTSDGYGNTYTYREDYFQDVNTKDTDSNWFHSSTANASLIQDSAWAAYDDATWQVNDLWGGTVERDDNLTGIIREDLLSSGEHYNAEGQAWIGLEEQLNALGFTFDKRTAQLRELEAGMGDAAGLYELLTTTTAFDGLALGADSYTNTIIDQLRSDDMDKVVAARQNEEQMNLIPELLKNENFDFLNTDDTVATVEETMDLLSQTMGDNTSLENLQFLTDYLTGFGEYSESAQQISAMADLAKSAIAANPEFELAEGQTEDELAMDILKDLQGELGDEFTIDMLLKINPTDIQFDETTGKYTIDDQAKELAQAIVNTETAKEKQATLANAEKAATADVISKEDYATLQASGLFETDEELRAFAAKGAAERAALWEQMNADAVAAEIEGLQQQKDAATAALAEVDEEIQTALENLADTVAENALNDGENGIWDQFAGLEGEALFSAINDERARVQAEMARKQAAIDEYNSWDESTSDEDKAAWREKYGVTEGQESSWISQTEDDIVGLTAEVEAYNDAMAEAEGAYNKKAYNQSVLDSAEDAIDQAEYWEEVGSKIEKAAKGAETYANAIGKLGDMDAEDLAWMQVQDENALNNYRTMSSDEWNKYAYEQSMQYYTDLMAMYDEDSIEYTMALEAKEEATQAYYDGLAEQAEQAADIQKDKWEETISAAESAMSSASGLISGDINFTNIENLKQSLIEAGVEVERVSELINNLQNAGGNTEQIKAAMVAASEAALAKLGTLNEQKQEYTGVVTNLDTSPIEPIDLPVGATTGEVDDTTLDEAREEFEADPITPTFDTPEGEETVAAEVNSWGEGKTVVFTDANGDQVKATIAGYGDNQTITYTDTATGQTVTKKISELGNGQTVTFTDANGNAVTATIASFGAGQVITYTDATTGETVTGVIAGFGANQTLTYINANGDAVSGTIAGFGTGQTITYTDATTGETVTAEIAGWGAGQTLTFVDATTGETVTATIQSFGDSQKLVYTTADGTTVVTDIAALGLGQTISFSTATEGQTLQASIDAIGMGQTIVFTNPETGETFEDTITGWTFTNEGLTLELASGAQTSVAADVLKWTGLANNNLILTPISTTQGDLQSSLDDMDLEAKVKLKFDGTDQLFQTMLTEKSAGLTSAQAADLAELYAMPLDQALATVQSNTQNNWWNALWSASDMGDAIWGQDSAMSAFMINAVNEIRNMTPEMAATMTDEIATILDIVTKGMQSDDPATRELATFLYQGLASGLSDCGNIDWRSILLAAGLDEEIVDAFCAALLIKSPSRLTMALAPYLFEGLSVGIAKGDANFKIEPLKGVTGVIQNAFQQAIDDGVNGIDVTKLESILGPEHADLLANFDRRHDFIQANSTIDETTGEAAWETIIGDEAWEAELDRIEREAEEAYRQSVAEPTTPNGVTATAIDVDAEEAGAQARREAIAAGEIDGVTKAEIRHRAIDEFYNTYLSWGEEIVAEYTIDYFSSKKWANDSNLSDIQKAAIGGAVEAALAEMGKNSSDIATFTDAEQAEFISLVQENLNQSGQDIEFALADTWAELKDIWVNGLSEIYKAEEELAQQVYELWEKTFDAVAKARLGLMDGKTIMETMFGSPDELAAIIQTWLGEGFTMAEINQMLYSTDTSVNFNPWDADNYHKSGPQRFLNRDANGNYTDTNMTQYNANVDTMVTEEIIPHLVDVLGETITQDEIDSMAQSQDPVQLALLEYLSTEAGGGLVTKTVDDETGEATYTINADRVTGDINTSDALTTEVAQGVAQTLYAETEEEVDGYLATAAATQQSQYYKRADVARQEGEQFIASKEEDKALLDRAREMKLAGESLDTLTAEEQDRLRALTGVQDLSTLSLETLNDATLKCAQAMLTCAQQVAIAMGMIQRGEIDSWSIGEDGSVTGYKSYTYGERGDMELTAEEQAGADQAYTRALADKGYSSQIIGGRTIYYNSQGEVVESTDGDLNKAITYAEGQRDAYSFDREVDLSGDAANIEGTDLESGLHAVTDETIEKQQAYANALGMTVDEFEDYTKTLYENGETGKKWTDLTEDEKQVARDFAVQAGKIANAWKNLTASQENNIKTIKQGQKSTVEYRKAMSSLKKDLKTVFGDATQITDDFVTSHMEDIEAMAKGDEEAAERVEKALLDDMLGNLSQQEVEIDVNADGVGDQLTTIGDMLNTFGDEFSDKEIGFEITADDSPAIAALNSVLEAGGMTADQIQAAMNAIGWEPEIEYAMVPMAQHEAGNTTAYVRDNAGNVVTVTATQATDTKNYVYVPMIKGAKKTGGGASGMKKLASPSGGGGGGGGGGDPKKIDKKKPEDEKERYHESEQTLERLADELEKVDKLKSRAYGKGHLDAIKQEISLLKQEVGVQADYLKQAQEYLTLDRNRVASLGATFNADGTISNYDELMDSIIAKYNAFVDKYNSSSAKQQEDMEEEKEQMDEWYEESMEWISQYEETLNLTRDKENEILELQNEISAKTLEGIQYKVEFEVELNEEETDFLDYLNEKYGEVLKKQDILVENLIRQQKLAQENLASLNNAKAELDAKYASGELTQADYITGLQDINDQILDNLSTLEDLRKEIQEAYGNALDMATEAINNHTEKMEHASQAMQSYISIMGLIGQGVDYEKIGEFYEKQYEYNLKSLDTQQQYLNTLKEEEAVYLAKMAAGDLTETERIQFEALQDTIAEVEDGILSKTEETLSALKEAFANSISGILRDFEESIAGAGNSLEDLASDYEYYLEVQERNVSTSKELYEVSKLNRQIEQDIADTSSSVYKQRLAALQEEIKVKSADRALTEYDIQMMNLEYELLQRQMALEEAKNAKDTVRLTRDSSGNYVYQYTANQDAVNEAQQGVEDVLQRMAEANAERVGQLEQETINTYQNMVSQIEEIANSEVLTQEEKNAKIAEIVAQAQEKMLWLQDQYGIATENTMATNALIQDHYNTDMITNAQISSEAMNETIAAIINKSTELSDGMATMQEQIGQEMAELEYDINTVLNTTAWDDAGEKISTYDQVVDDATTEVDEMIDTLSGEDGLLDSIKDTTAAWDAQAAAIDALIKYYEDLYVSITKAQNAQANVTNPSTGGSVTDPGTDTETPEEEEETPEESNKVQYQGGTWKFYTYGQESGGKKGAIFYGNGKAPVVTKEDEGDNRIKISGEDGKGNTFSSRWIAKVHRGKELWKAYAMGGLVDYTGPAWVDGTKSQPELMLNATDTQNMLAAVQTVRALDSATLNMLDEFIKLATSSMLSAGNLHASGVASTDTELQQQVQITAEFPNVQDSNEIQDAFDNLINRAAQYIGSKK